MKYLTVHEIATTLRISEHTARRYCANGSIRAAKVGRQWLATPEAVEAFATPAPVKPETERRAAR